MADLVTKILKVARSGQGETDKAASSTCGLIKLLGKEASSIDLLHPAETQVYGCSSRNPITCGRSSTRQAP